jgi:DNA-binding response OmpR family regulator
MTKPDRAQALLLLQRVEVGDLLTPILRSAGFHVSACNSVAEVLQAGGEDRPSCAILDLSEGNGLGLARLAGLRATPRGAQLPILTFASAADPALSVRALREGADDHLSLPLDPQELVARVERLTTRSNHQAPLLAGDLETYPLALLLQSLAQHRQSGELVIEIAQIPASIVLTEGAPVTARLGDLEGVEALHAIAAETAGRFHLRHTEVPVEARPGSPLPGFSALLLDMAWLEDEVAQRASWLPRPDEGLELVAIPAPTDPELQALPFLPVATRLGQNPGSTASELGKRLHLAPNRLRFVLAWMLEHGHVRRQGTDLEPEAEAHRPAEGEAHASAARPAGTTNLPVILVYAPSCRTEVEQVIQGTSGLERWTRNTGGELPPTAGTSLTLEAAGRRTSIWLRAVRLEAVGEIFERASRSAAVVLWIGDDVGEVVFSTRLLQAAAGARSQLFLVSPSRAAHERLVGPLGERSRWARLPSPIASLQELVAAVSEGSVGARSAETPA